MYQTNDPRWKKLRQEVRSKATNAERELWSALRKKQLHGFKFRRNHQILRYYVDFFCHEKKLAIEIDGEIHDEPEQKEYDMMRTEELTTLGIHVMRFKNSDIENNFSIVLETIYQYLTSPSN